MNNKFPFEDFTLIMTRDCNLSCEYCPLIHFKGNIKKNVLEIFFNKISKFQDYKIYITLFGGEPLLNKAGIKYIYKILLDKKEIFIKNNILITLKIVTNGTLLNNSYIKLLRDINSLIYINLVLNISIDGDKSTQLKQRSYKIGYIDYYNKLKNSIHDLLKSNIKVEFGMVLSFFNDNFFKDIIYLIKEFNIPIFIMPVDLTLEYIKKDEDIFSNIREYMINIEKTLKLIELNNLTTYIINYHHKYRDLKIPPIGPTIDINGDMYSTRDFLFTMDKSIKFPIIGNIKEDNLIRYFIDNNIGDIEQKTLRLYYGETFIINKTIGNYFTKLIYKK